ncbi:MAG: HAMP domain-containing protein, partial [Parahaliea sp.]
MKVAQRISLTVGLTTFLVASPLLLILYLQQFKTEERLLLRDLNSAVEHGSELQADIYLRNSAGLRAQLRELLAVSPAVRQAAIFDREGNNVQELAQDGAGNVPSPPFSVVRDSAQPVDVSLVAMPDLPAPRSFSLLAKLTNSERILYMTAPVFSLLDPNTAGLQRHHFLEPQLDPDANSSRYVAGYVRLTVSRRVLLQDALPSLSAITALSLLVALACMLASWLTASRVTSPLSQLIRVAEGIASGTQKKTVLVTGSGEIGELGSVLNNMIDSLSEFRTQTGADQALLRLKVDERTAQLSSRNRELSIAVAEATKARNRLRHMAYFDSLTDL